MGKNSSPNRLVPFLLAALLFTGCSSPSAIVETTASSQTAQITIPLTQPVTIPETKPLASTTTPKTFPITIPATTPVTVSQTIPATTPVTVPQTVPVTIPETKPATSPSTTSVTAPTTAETIGSLAKLKTHFINVGQADAILIQLPNNQNMLIDAGESSNGAGVVSYIKNLGIKKLDFVVATHPHADHIGGMATVINSFATDNFYMPRKQHTTKTFENMLDALINKNVKVIEAKAGVSILNTSDLDINILGPSSSASRVNPNNYSAIIRIRYKEADFLFVGDAESAELSGLSSMNMDVLKVGHHGSDTSSPVSFLNKVDPEYSVISVGSNSYGHPSRSTLGNLNSVGSKVYRTDQSGTIIISSDGKKIEVNKSPAKAVASATPPVTVTQPKTTKPPVKTTPTTQPKTTKPPTKVASIVYGTATGTKYHKSGCRYLSKSKIPMTLSKAKSSGLTACSVCH